MFSTSGDIMMHVGEQVDKSLSSSIENLDVLNTPLCAHDIPLMYSLYPPDVLMVSPTCIMVSPTCIMISPDVLNNPRCTHDIPLMCSWYPFNVLHEHPQCTHDMPLTYLTPPPPPPRCTYGIPQCTEHLSMY